MLTLDYFSKIREHPDYQPGVLVKMEDETGKTVGVYETKQVIPVRKGLEGGRYAGYVFISVKNKNLLDGERERGEAEKTLREVNQETNRVSKGRWLTRFFQGIQDLLL